MPRKQCDGAQCERPATRNLELWHIDYPCTIYLCADCYRDHLPLATACIGDQIAHKGVL